MDIEVARNDKYIISHPKKPNSTRNLAPLDWWRISFGHFSMEVNIFLNIFFHDSPPKRENTEGSNGIGKKCYGTGLILRWETDVPFIKSNKILLQKN